MRLGADAGSCELVGNWLSDIEAFRAVGVAAIGYANNAWKIDAFPSADIVVTSVGEIAEALPPVSPLSEGGN